MNPQPLSDEVREKIKNAAPDICESCGAFTAEGYFMEGAKFALSLSADHPQEQEGKEDNTTALMGLVRTGWTMALNRIEEYCLQTKVSPQFMDKIQELLNEENKQEFISEIFKKEWDAAGAGYTVGQSSQKEGGLDEETIKEIEKMADETFAGSEAIMFGEWLLENDFEVQFVSNERKWVSRDSRNKFLGFHGDATTTKLYEIYKKYEHAETNRAINRRRLD